MPHTPSRACLAPGFLCRWSPEPAPRKETQVLKGPAKWGAEPCCILTPRGSLLCCNKLCIQPVLSWTKQLTPTSEHWSFLYHPPGW